MTWKEWLVCLVIGLPLFLAGMVAFGMTVESFGEYQERITNAEHAIE